ncbi:MAG TPA: Smr/MutS family protein [Steroidobacteraceae bacterium]|nr:Smr/MutS family protein [Steroidobacteraceae bacterium]
MANDNRTKIRRPAPETRREPDGDAELFREAMRGVAPLKRTPRHVPARPKPPPRARFRRADEAAVLEESLTLAPGELAVETGDELSYRRPGIAETVLRKLRRGDYRVDREVDLHGFNARDAHAALGAFLASAIASNAHCVRVIHGKGRRSGPRGPVLKNMVSKVLRRTAAVVAFVSARPADGGTGALYVLLAK